MKKELKTKKASEKNLHVKAKKETAEIEKPEAAAPIVERFIEAVGRRKTSIARVRITEMGKRGMVINKKELETYFPTFELQNIVLEPFKKAALKKSFSLSSKVSGGGIHSQAEAVRHGISRALVKYDEALRLNLKPFGFLKRDPRMKERRKFGLKKARKAPQWSKR
ncbi:30S ribosomal protein S9 [Candidatus Giovannonibacteria bacterium]|nr:30S ribosomal protein S9 [Candidatus Giovannonibacteria bacterium]